MRCQRPRQRSDWGLLVKARPLFAALGLCALLGASGEAAAESLTDLHDVTIGMSAQDLPASGYHNLSCLGTTNQPVESWHDLMSCPANADGLRGLHVEYDQPGHDETLVAGHPVDLSLFFDGSARLVRIEIKTKDQTSLYMRKKAYRLGLQAKEHYGDEGWTCKQAQPSANEEALGPTYINDTCSKTADNRAIEVTNRFFHKSGGAAKDFVSQSLVVVSLRTPDSK
jgi:hypothetical protein